MIQRWVALSQRRLFPGSTELIACHFRDGGLISTAAGVFIVGAIQRGA